MNKEYLLDKGFISPINQSIDFLIEADLEQAEYKKSQKIKWCAISLAFNLEAAANCCIFELGMGSDIFKSVDKLPVIDKFEIFLQMMFRIKLDRSNSLVAKAREIVKIRDFFAHRKVRKVTDETLSELYSNLGVGRDSSVWTVEDGIVIFKAFSGFMRYFLIEQCGFDQNTACDLLWGSDRWSNPSPVTYGCGIEEYISANKRWKLDLFYLGL